MKNVFKTIMTAAMAMAITATAYASDADLVEAHIKDSHDGVLTLSTTIATKAGATSPVPHVVSVIPYIKSCYTSSDESGTDTIITPDTFTVGTTGMLVITSIKDGVVSGSYHYRHSEFKGIDNVVKNSDCTEQKPKVAVYEKQIHFTAPLNQKVNVLKYTDTNGHKHEVNIWFTSLKEGE